MNIPMLTIRRLGSGKFGVYDLSHNSFPELIFIGDSYAECILFGDALTDEFMK